MIEVSKQEFFAAISGPENIHPTSGRDHTVWKNQRTGEIVGRTALGWASRSGKTERYCLTEAFARPRIEGESK